jgi:hypothetical protein
MVAHTAPRSSEWPSDGVASYHGKQSQDQIQAKISRVDNFFLSSETQYLPARTLSRSVPLAAVVGPTDALVDGGHQGSSGAAGCWGRASVGFLYRNVPGPDNPKNRSDLVRGAGHRPWEQAHGCRHGSGEGRGGVGAGAAILGILTFALRYDTGHVFEQLRPGMPPAQVLALPGETRSEAGSGGEAVRSRKSPDGTSIEVHSRDGKLTSKEHRPAGSPEPSGCGSQQSVHARHLGRRPPRGCPRGDEPTGWSRVRGRRDLRAASSRAACSGRGRGSRW